MGKEYKINKKGTDKILSMYWFVLLTLIAGGVFAMVYVFYGAPYDIREVESALLVEKIADCISERGTIDSEFFAADSGELNANIGEDFIKKCFLNFEVEKGYTENEIQYFYEVEFYTIKNTEASILSFNGGNTNLREDCFIKKENDKEYTSLAKCTQNGLYALDSEGNQYLIKILSAIDKSEKNVK